MKKIRITSSRAIGENEPVFISADIGKNHNCSMKEAEWLVDKANEAGVDAVKFQTHVVDDEQRKVRVVAPHFKARDRYSWVKQNTLPKEWWQDVFDYAKSRGVICYSTPMSCAAAELLEEVGVCMFKISSADVTDLFLVETVAKTGKPVIISSGMNSLEDIELAIRKIREYHDNVVLLHCVSEYPCPPKRVNLRVIGVLRQKFGLPVGFSDHSLENDAAVAAVALGAVAIEKHFSRNRKQFGPDHKFSLTPAGLKDLVRRVRGTELALGDGKRVLSKNEAAFIPVFHKSLVAKTEVLKGTIVCREMLAAKRPGEGGLPPKFAAKVVGKKAKRTIRADSLVLLEDLE